MCPPPAPSNSIMDESALPVPLETLKYQVIAAIVNSDNLHDILVAYKALSPQGFNTMFPGLSDQPPALATKEEVVGAADNPLFDGACAAEVAPTPRASQTSSRRPSLEGLPGAQECLRQLREQLDIERLELGPGGRGIPTLGKAFRDIDGDGDGRLKFEEFDRAIREHAEISRLLELNPGDSRALFDFFDMDCTGGISYNEFLEGLQADYAI